MNICTLKAETSSLLLHLLLIPLTGRLSFNLMQTGRGFSEYSNQVKM
jgi:hypothetical protein